MRKIKIGIGFATGRRSFRKVLGAYVNTWNASRALLPPDVDASLSLFVSYDVDYHGTVSTDYTNLSQDMVDAFDSIVFIGAKNAQKSIESLGHSGGISRSELKSVFGAGYAGKRNAILYSALENHMDYLLFLDDDEYPMAVTNNHDQCLWSGQRVVYSHLRAIGDADFTNGRHCGYISPIPQIEFGKGLGEQDFRAFIEAISNDIINWDSIRQLMESGGVTYASTDVLINGAAEEVRETSGCKFISGANLCVNLTRPERTLPFYNPPGARGEDTFLSTMLSDRKVLRIPCYAFHDGFSICQHLLDGALPIRLPPVRADSPAIVTRFVNACTGWVRYKPLLMYITAPDSYDAQTSSIREALSRTLPKMAGYFEDDRFFRISGEFEKYSANVGKHFDQYLQTQSAWEKIVGTIK